MDPDWRDARACAGPEYPVDMFLVSNRGVYSRKAALACEGCPARVPCLTHLWWDEYMLVGGTTPDDRRRARRRGWTPVQLIARTTRSALVA